MLKEKFLTIMTNTAYDYMNQNPEKRMLKLVDLIDKLDKKNVLKAQCKVFREIIKDKDSNWYKYIISIWEDIDSEIRKVFFRNFICNATLFSSKNHNKLKRKYECNIPFAILMDPTSACNLNCLGCWAAQYGSNQSMSIKTLDNIIVQGKELGIHFYAYSGGEPLIRKDDIIKLCDKHKDCIFTAFTNGTLIDEAFTDEMQRVKNFIPAISIEGFEDETDARRGKGTYKAVTAAMELLKKKKLAFGASCCYTCKNTEVIGSEAFIDDLIAKGAKFVWFFTYIPVGADAVPELIVTANQRELMYRQINNFRKTKPIFCMDFWNDGEYAGGCVAGGRRYLHINSAGDIEPCAFIHYSDSNIYNKSILDALQGPLFIQYYKNQPFNCNHLRPCPLLDNPQRLVEMVEKSGAKSTDLLHPENVKELTQRCEEIANQWAVAADRLWACTHTDYHCDYCKNGKDKTAGKKFT
ncbi:radical SAM protein [Anaerocolumna sp. MB42-C2]|uniref:radical SAM protein n=1 Tax=Anaerocolumna sp. MB42-C2 TaxID=3070997 RepID=UPI0027DF66FE|nr:radical SAM protein [Anaerocolumna sp. MB42-C2]WMJ86955.1 radical SAM protein [Anaerocolumna sp. MB42-C2]